MDDPATIDKLLDERLRATQIIVAALLMGVLVFIGVELFRQFTNQPPKAVVQTPTISYATAAVVAGALLAWAIVPSRLADKEVSKIAAGTWTAPSNPPASPESFTTDTAKLLAVHQTKSIIAGALLEGPAFLSGVAYMTERQPFALGIVAVAVLLMVVTFPPRRRVLRWLESQLVRIDELRQFGDSSAVGR